MLTDVDFCDPYIVARLVSGTVPLLGVVPVPDLFILSVQSLFHLPRRVLNGDLETLGDDFAPLLKLLMHVPPVRFQLADIDDHVLPKLLDLYGALHARFVNTEEGLAKYYVAYKEGRWGACGRESCRNNVVPFQQICAKEDDDAKFYCLKCDEVYDESYFACTKQPEKRYYPSGLVGKGGLIGPNVLLDFLRLHAKKLHRKRNKKRYKRKVKYGVYSEAEGDVYERLIANDLALPGYLQQQASGADCNTIATTTAGTIYGFRIRRQKELVAKSFPREDRLLAGHAPIGSAAAFVQPFLATTTDPAGMTQQDPTEPTEYSPILASSDEPNPQIPQPDVFSTPKAIASNAWVVEGNAMRGRGNAVTYSTVSSSCEHFEFHLQYGVPICTLCAIPLQCRPWNTPLPLDSLLTSKTGGLRYYGRALATYYARIVQQFSSLAHLLRYIQLSGEKLESFGEVHLVSKPPFVYSPAYIAQPVSLPAYTLLPYSNSHSLQSAADGADIHGDNSGDDLDPPRTSLYDWLQALSTEQISREISEGLHFLCETSVLLDAFDDRADDIEESILIQSVSRILFH